MLILLQEVQMSLGRSDRYRCVDNGCLWGLGEGGTCAWWLLVRHGRGMCVSRMHTHQELFTQVPEHCKICISLWNVFPNTLTYNIVTMVLVLLRDSVLSVACVEEGHVFFVPAGQKQCSVDMWVRSPVWASRPMVRCYWGERTCIYKAIPDSFVLILSEFWLCYITIFTISSDCLLTLNYGFHGVSSPHLLTSYIVDHVHTCVVSAACP